MTANSTSPHRLNAQLLECLSNLTNAAREPHRGFDPIVYRDGLKKAFVDIKQMASRVLECGHIGGLDMIGSISDTLQNLGGSARGRVGNEVFWDQLSQHYIVKGDWEAKLELLSTPLQIRLFGQMVSQEADPYTVIRNQLQQVSDEAFMECFTLALKMSMPSEISYSTKFFEPLYSLKQRISKPDFIPGAVEHIAAHQDLYLGYFAKVLTVSGIYESMPKENGEDLGDWLNRKRTRTLEVVGYSSEQIAELFPTLAFTDVLPHQNEYPNMKKALAFTPEFLSMLHEAIPSPLLLEIAEISMSDPVGAMPFVFFERMGLKKSAEWHIKAQDSAVMGKAIIHYEHAIHTPGLELSVAKVANQPFTSKDIGLLNRIVEVLTKVNLRDPECRRKGQMLFDALVTNMGFGKSGMELKEIIEHGSIPGAFYSKHPELKGKKLESDLGM